MTEKYKILSVYYEFVNYDSLGLSLGHGMGEMGHDKKKKKSKNRSVKATSDKPAERVTK